MIVKRNELYDIVSRVCNAEYAVGLHGIDKNRLKYLNNIDDTDIAISKIIKEGLKVFHSRTIHGTVAFFGRVDIDKEKVYKGLNTYNYVGDSYIIVAIPTVFTKGSKEIYLGTPNLDSEYISYMGTTGDYTTTLLDSFIKKDEKIPSEFIFGSFKVLDDGMIDIEINPNHVTNTNTLNLEKYETDFIYLDHMLRMYGLNLDYFRRDISEELVIFLENKINELESKLYRISDIFSNNRFLASILETLKQLLSEIKKEKVIEEINEINVDSIMTAELKRGQYYSYGEKYYIEFKYSKELEEKKVFELFDSYLLPTYGVFSSRGNSGDDYIMPFLGRNKNVIGGTSIPDDLLVEFIKILKENGITIITNDNDLSNLIESNNKKLF